MIRAGPGQAEPSPAEPSRASRARPSRAKPSRAEASWAGPGRDSPNGPNGPTNSPRRSLLNFFPLRDTDRTYFPKQHFFLIFPMNYHFFPLWDTDRTLGEKKFKKSRDRVELG